MNVIDLKSVLLETGIKEVIMKSLEKKGHDVKLLETMFDEALDKKIDKLGQSLESGLNNKNINDIKSREMSIDDLLSNNELDKKVIKDT